MIENKIFNIGDKIYIKDAGIGAWWANNHKATVVEMNDENIKRARGALEHEVLNGEAFVVRLSDDTYWKVYYHGRYRLINKSLLAKITHLLKTGIK